jgi:hypothetical protein
MMARRAPGKSRREPESLLDIVRQIEAQAAQARVEAADDPVEPWDLLDLDPAVSGPAWERWMAGAKLAE